LRRCTLRTSILFLTCLGLAACRVGQTPRPDVLNPDSAARADIEAVMAGYAAAMLRSDAAGMAAFFTPDARLSAPDADDLAGPRAIRDAMHAFFASGATVMEVDVETDVLHIDGPDAFEFGRYTESFRLPDGEEHTVQGRYSIQWRRGAEARWRIRRFLANHLPDADADADTAAAVTAANR
jgi:uncharacterized protein (TIGR02246 family)